MTAALHKRILDAYETTIKALDLDGVQARVYLRMTLTETWVMNVQFPCVVLAPVGIEVFITNYSQSDDFGFPVTVRIVDRASTATEPIGDYLQWRETIKRAFQNKRLSGRDGEITEVYRSLVQPSPSIEVEFLPYQLLSMPLIFQVEARQLRS